jgi:hypothetical protein
MSDLAECIRLPQSLSAPTLENRRSSLGRAANYLNKLTLTIQLIMRSKMCTKFRIIAAPFYLEVTITYF